MARIEVVMPQMGESIAEGTIVKWHKKVGDQVRKDETLLEISTDKVDSEIPSPASGRLAEISVAENQTVSVRTVIGYIESDAGAALGAPAEREEGRVATPPPAPPQGENPPAAERRPKETEPAQPQQAERAAASAPVSPPSAHRRPGPPPVAGPAAGGAGREKASAAAERFYSPLVMSIARSEGIPMGELERIRGTGEGGRVTKRDILTYIDGKKHPRDGEGQPVEAATESMRPQVNAPAAEAGAHGGAQVPGGSRTAAPAPIQATPVEAPELRSRYPSPQHEILQMSNVLQRMAQHMVTSVQTSPHVAAIHEVDMTEVVKHRTAHAQEFERREGFKLTYTPYIVDAVVRAIKKYPLVNCSVEGDKIIKKNYVNLGIAVASENGLIVPVIKHAEEKSFLGYARAVHDLAQRTRSKKLTPDDIQGGTFTITNYGVFGTMIGTPIINQPQVAILGTGAITRRLAVVEHDALAVRSIAYFTLSFDHRVVDGALGGMFMNEVVTTLEGFTGTSEL